MFQPQFYRLKFVAVVYTIVNFCLQGSEVEKEFLTGQTSQKYREKPRFIPLIMV